MFEYLIHLTAYVFLKEHLHWLDMLAIPLTIVGIVFFAQPSFLGFSETNYDSESYLGMFFAVLSSILAASCFNIIRKIGKSAHYTVTVFYYSCTGMLIIGTIISLTTGFTFPCQVFSYTVARLLLLLLFRVIWDIFSTLDQMVY